MNTATHNWTQISCEDSKSSSPKPERWWPWDLVCNIWDVWSTQFVQMMILGWPWHALHQGQICFLMHWNLKPFEKLILWILFLTIELKFPVKTPYDKLAKIYANYFGHKTKMTATPIYGKVHLKIFFSRTRRPVILGLGMYHWKCGVYQVCSNDDPKFTLSYLTSRSNLLPNAFKWGIFWKVDFWILLKPK